MTAQIQEFQFQAETKQLLDLMINSLYTNKEIFLRELISNASDALDRFRFEALTNPDLGSSENLEIRLDVDKEARTLTIIDNGIGMSREEVIENIGTIAKSGTRELREKLKESNSDQALSELIGQFGVGFYSAFMVSDKVSLITRRAGENAATRWESIGDGTYSIGNAEYPGHGTSITLQLKQEDSEAGIEDFTDSWVLGRIVRRYSDFVSYPIKFKDEYDELEQDEAGIPDKDGKTRHVIEDKTLNSMKPLWVRAQSEVTESDYAEFYRHITHDWEAPFQTLALRAEGRIEYEALLFIPSKAPQDLFYHASESGLRLYAKRVMIMETCEALLPRYLRFIKGIVDSADLPLNISRQTLQQDRHIAQIRKWLTKKILDHLTDLYETKKDEYLVFWKEFGRALKEGVSSDYENRDKIISLLLFPSSNDPEQLVTLKEYASRMKENQQDIYYLTGESRSVVENSPHLEIFKDKEYEVLYLTDPVDELLVQSLTEFEGKRIKSAGKGKIELGDQEEKERTSAEIKQKEEESAKLLEFLQKKLDKYVKHVRLTNRLTVSPVCLVNTEIDYSPQLERLLQKGKGGGSRQRRIMELNPNHEIFLKMKQRFEANQDDPIVASCADLLLGYGLLAEGSELPDPVQYNRLVADLMMQSL